MSEIIKEAMKQIYFFRSVSIISLLSLIFFSCAPKDIIDLPIEARHTIFYSSDYHIQHGNNIPPLVTMTSVEYGDFAIDGVIYFPGSYEVWNNRKGVIESFLLIWQRKAQIHLEYRLGVCIDAYTSIKNPFSNMLVIGNNFGEIDGNGDPEKDWADINITQTITYYYKTWTGAKGQKKINAIYTLSSVGGGDYKLLCQ